MSDATVLVAEVGPRHARACAFTVYSLFHLARVSTLSFPLLPFGRWTVLSDVWDARCVRRGKLFADQPSVRVEPILGWPTRLTVAYVRFTILDRVAFRRFESTRLTACLNPLQQARTINDHVARSVTHALSLSSW